MKAFFNPALGRWTVYVPGRGNLYRYRLLMEKHLGCQLRSDEHVHHINGDRTDDRLENLKVLSASEHARLHIPDRLAGQRAARGDGWGPDGLESCVECGTDERPHVALGECGRCYFRNRQRQKHGHQPRRPPTVLALTCQDCGAEFERTLHQGRRSYCSRSCASRANAKRRWAERAAGRVDAIGKRAAA